MALEKGLAARSPREMLPSLSDLLTLYVFERPGF